MSLSKISYDTIYLDIIFLKDIVSNLEKWGNRIRSTTFKIQDTIPTVCFKKLSSLNKIHDHKVYFKRLIYYSKRLILSDNDMIYCLLVNTNGREEELLVNGDGAKEGRGNP